MKTKPLLTLFLSLLSCIPALAATAPDSIAGKIYRSNATFTHNRYESTIIFGTDGRFIFLKDAWGQRLVAPTAWVAVQAPKADGTYRYERVNDTDATLTLSHDDGTTTNLPLTFTSTNGGGRPDPISASSFFLTDLSAAESVPARNISMRGRVSPGQPLIVGFIVPGTPPPPRTGSVPSPGERFQEMVIRVVGPSLRPFGISNGWADPDFKLYLGSAPAELDEGHNPDWEGGLGEGRSPDSGKGLTKIFSYLGAFQLQPGAKDAVDVVRLKPGAYTVVCDPAANDAGGEVLIEVYFLP